MRTRRENHRELMLEVEHNGFRCIVYRSTTAGGREVFVEESNLMDCSRPADDEQGYPVHFSMKEAWAAINGYTSIEGMLARRAWHLGGSEWVGLNPVFIHPDMRPLVQRSLAQVTRDASLNNRVSANIGQWLHALTQENAPISNGLFNHVNTYRHAS